MIGVGFMLNFRRKGFHFPPIKLSWEPKVMKVDGSGR